MKESNIKNYSFLKHPGDEIFEEEFFADFSYYFVDNYIKIIEIKEVRNSDKQIIAVTNETKKALKAKVEYDEELIEKFKEENLPEFLKYQPSSYDRQE